MLVRHHIGHDGSRGRADDAHGHAHEQALHKEQKETGNPEEGRNAQGVEQQPRQQNRTAAAQGKQIPCGKAPGKTADDHDARRQPGCAQIGVVGCPGIGGAGDEHQIVGRHDQQIDDGHDGEIAVENGPQGFACAACVPGGGS